MTALHVRGTFARDRGFRVGFDLALPLAGVTAVLGESGAGKSTLLRCIAGLEPGSRDVTVRFDDEIWQDAAHWLPPHCRPVSTVFQESRLFPHLTVAQNLRIAVRLAERTRHRTGFRLTLDETIERLALAPLLRSRPSSLSGGQRQRVALARALLVPAKLWLFDEPLASLDTAARREIAPYLQALCRAHAVPVIYVTHDLTEVLQIAERVVRVADGGAAGFEAIERFGEGGAVLTCRRRRALPEHGLTELALGTETLYLRGALRAEQTRIRLFVPARDVSLSRRRLHDASVLNQLQGRIVALEDDGAGNSRVLLDCQDQRLSAQITQLSRTQMGLEIGHTVFALIKTVALATLGDERHSVSGGTSQGMGTGRAEASTGNEHRRA